MREDGTFTEEELKTFCLDGELDDEAKTEFEQIEVLNKKYANTINPNEDQEGYEQLYLKKQKEMDKLISMYRDFDPDEIIISKNETGLPDVMFF